MSVRKIVDSILQQYGTTMTVQHKDGLTAKAKGFFHHIQSKSWQNTVHLSTPLGEVSREQYVYIGPVAIEVREGDTLIHGHEKYSFQRVELYYYRDRVIYVWGLCTRKGEEDTWGSQS